MDDHQILLQIHELITAEHDLRARVQREGIDPETERREVRRLEETLDQCWDLLRQRRARREFGQDVDGATARDVDVVEKYQQ